MVIFFTKVVLLFYVKKYFKKRGSVKLGKRRYGKIGVSAVVIIAFLLMSFVSFAQTTSTPLLKAGLAYLNAQNAKTIDEELRIDLRFSAGNNADKDSKLLEEVLKKSYIKCRVLEDVSTKEASMTMSFYINNQQALSGKMYANTQYAAFYFPDLYSKPIYSDVYSSANLNGVSIDVQKYAELFDFQNNKDLQNVVQGYAGVVLPKLSSIAKMSDKKVEITFSDGKKQSCDEIIFELNKPKTIDLLKTILSKAAEDKQTKEYILKVAKEFLDYAKQTGDLDKLAQAQVSPEEIEAMLAEIDKNYESTLKEAVSKLDTLSNSIPPFTFQYRMMVDDKNNLKGERLYFYLKDSNNLKVMINIQGVINSVNQPVKIEKIDKSKAVDINKLTDKEQQDIQNKATNKLAPFLVPFMVQ